VRTSLGVAIGALLGAALGLVFGANIGGNYAPDSEILGLRGYEGAGRLGLLLGVVAGGLCGRLLARKRGA
jgi:hypothetical protein